MISKLISQVKGSLHCVIYSINAVFSENMSKVKIHISKACLAPLNLIK